MTEIRMEDSGNRTNSFINNNYNDNNLDDARKRSTSLWGCFVKDIELLLSIFKGRAGRKEYWSSIVFNFLTIIFVACIAFIVNFLLILIKAPELLFMVFSIIPAVAVAILISINGVICSMVFVKRLHDLGISARVCFFTVMSVFSITAFFADRSIIMKNALSVAIIVFILFAIIYMGCVKGKNEPNKYGTPVN